MQFFVLTEKDVILSLRTLSNTWYLGPALIRRKHDLYPRYELGYRTVMTESLQHAVGAAINIFIYRTI